MADDITYDDLALVQRLARGDDELESHLGEALVHAVRRFDGRGVREGFVVQRLMWARADYYRNVSKRPKTVPLPTGDDENDLSHPQAPELPQAVERALEALPEAVRAHLRAGTVDGRYSGVREALKWLRAELT